MIVYRPHRGSLEDAMKEVKTFDNWYQMTHYIANNWNFAVGKKVIDSDDIVMDDKSVNDDRVGWKDVHMVLATRIGNDNFMEKYGNPQCIGYCTYDVSSVKKYLTPKEVGAETFIGSKSSTMMTKNADTFKLRSCCLRMTRMK